MKTKHLFLLALVLSIFGCKTRELEPGVYNGDKVLYLADLSIKQGYDTLHAFVTWESENREVLKMVPEIHSTAEHVRANAEKWIMSAKNLRNAYDGNPTEENRIKLQTALNVISTAILETQKFKSK